MSNTETWYWCWRRNVLSKPKPIEIQRYTDKSVWVLNWSGDSTRKNRMSEGECFFKTYEEAVKFLIQDTLEEMQRSKARTNTLNERAHKFRVWLKEGP